MRDRRGGAPPDTGACPPVLVTPGADRAGFAVSMTRIQVDKWTASIANPALRGTFRDNCGPADDVIVAPGQGDDMHRPILCCVTWNVHRAVGRDGRRDGARTVDAVRTDINRHHPRVLALQEADLDDAPHPALLDMDELERVTGLRSVHDGDDMRWSPVGGGFLGNVLLLDPDVDVRSRRIIDLPGRCPRAAVMAEIVVDGRALRLVSCHLSLGQALRAVQLRTVGQVVARRAAMQTILLGDLNEWRPWGGLALSHRMMGMRLSGPARRTFPAAFPVLPLDRILSDDGAVTGVRALDGAAIRAASDHRPLMAQVALRAQAA